MQQSTWPTLILPDVRQMLADNDVQGLSEFCTVLHPAMVASVVEELKDRQVWRVLDNCSLERRVEIFEYITLHRQEDLVAVLDRDRLADLLEEMSPDDRVDLLTRMPEERVETLLPLIAQAERNDIRKLLSYPEDSAGSIMTTEYASLPEDITAGEAIARLRTQAPDSETIYYVYILSENRRLDGLISLRELILARPETRLADVMQRDVISVRVTDDQEDVAQELARYNFIAIPVVDDANSLVGIVTHDDVLDVVQEEATEDAHRLGAVEPLEDSYLETPLITIGWKRGIWLTTLAVIALATAKVLDYYKTLTPGDNFEFLILFLPLVLASGGNAGSQSATLIIRALALGEYDRRDSLKMTWREVLIGLLLGVTVASIGMLAAALFFGLTLAKAAVVGVTVVLVVLLGTVSGALLPLLFRRLGMDPAIMSNPLIAALVDVLGVVIYYTVALKLLQTG